MEHCRKRREMWNETRGVDKTISKSLEQGGIDVLVVATPGVLKKSAHFICSAGQNRCVSGWPDYLYNR